MKTDVLNRRNRFAKPQPRPRDKAIVIGEGDRAIFRALRRHGPLPTNFLYEAVRDHYRDYHAFQQRLTKLYNGAQTSEPYLSRLIIAPQPQAFIQASYQPFIYDLNERSAALLFANFFPPGDPIPHRVMRACVSLSIELECKKLGLRYIHKEAVLTGTEMFEEPGTYHSFFVEIDRNSERISGKRSATTFDQKIEGYFDVLDNRRYRTFLTDPKKPMLINISSGCIIPDDYFVIHVSGDNPAFRKRPRILTVTTNENHAANLAWHTENKNHPRRDSFIFTAVPHFGREWSIPRELLSIVPSLTVA